MLNDIYKNVPNIYIIKLLINITYDKISDINQRNNMYWLTCMLFKMLMWINY